MPLIAEGMAKTGRHRDSFEVTGGGFIATGATDEEVARMAEWVRYRVAFYGSTPAYLPTLACHGWEEVHNELSPLCSDMLFSAPSEGGTQERGVNSRAGAGSPMSKFLSSGKRLLAYYAKWSI